MLALGVFFGRVHLVHCPVAAQCEQSTRRVIANSVVGLVLFSGARRRGILLGLTQPREHLLRFLPCPALPGFQRVTFDVAVRRDTGAHGRLGC